MADIKRIDAQSGQVIPSGAFPDFRTAERTKGEEENGPRPDRPLVSVIVGVYNKERFVEACLRSVLGQTCPNWELLVVDDASTDGSLATVRKVLSGEARAQVFARKENSGLPGVTRNQALRMAQGKYVAFLDADDCWKPGKLAAQLAYMEAHPEYPMTHTVCEETDETGRVLRVRHGGVLPPPGDCLAALFRHCFICTSTVMVLREFGERVGWFSEEPEYRRGEDWDFFVRCAKECGIGVPDGIWGEYRNVNGSISHVDENWKSTPSDYVRSSFFLRRKNLWKGKISASEMRKTVWEAAMENCQHWRGRENWKRAGWFAREMLKLRPWAVDTWRQIAGVALRRR
jgi:glycosyltransferase involved in cell wall biosynthesis